MAAAILGPSIKLSFLKDVALHQTLTISFSEGAFAALLPW